MSLYRLAEWNGLLEVLIARRACANAGSLSYDEQLSFYDRLRPHLPDVDLKVHILNSHSNDWNTVPVHRNATDVLKTMKINEEKSDRQTSNVLQILDRVRPQREHMASAAALVAAVNGRRFVDALFEKMRAANLRSATATTLRRLAREVVKQAPREVDICIQPTSLLQKKPAPASLFQDQQELLLT